MRTVPGVSPADFAAAVEAFAKVVGPEWVFTSDGDLDLYRDSYSPLRGTPEERTAAGAVAPKSTEEVQAVVRIANKYRIPIYPISTGKNLGYGGAAPALSGSVVLDLKRMNRIIEVNDRAHYCIVEPGVSYFDLYNYIQERNLEVWIDCPDPGWGSLVGNALDHGIGYTGTRFRNHFEAHCGMEVVLPNGELLRTGMGAMPNSGTWQQFRNGFGPVIGGMFSQSNLGVVTKMGFWLMPAPEACLRASIFASRYEDLHAVVDLMNYLENSGLATGAPQLISPLLGLGSTTEMMDAMFNGPPARAAEHQRLIAGSSIGYSPQLERYGQDNGLAYWRLDLLFYGPPNVVTAQWDAARDRASRSIKGLRFAADPVLQLPVAEPRQHGIHAQQLGMPNLEFFVFGTRAGGNPSPSSGHMWFSPMIPRSGEAIIQLNTVFDEAVRTNPTLGSVPILGLRPFALPMGLFERCFACVLGFPVMDDPDQNKAFVQAFRNLIHIAAEHGWGEYRTPVAFQDQVMGTYSFNNNILRSFLETIKDAVDPRGILSAGRYGIWPKHLRSQS